MSLEKLNESKGIILDLAKTKSIGAHKAKVKFVLDYSGSMQPLYDNGDCQRLLNRIFPLALAFDDDGAMEMFLFSHYGYRVQPDVTLANYSTYIKDSVMKYQYGSTAYSTALQLILNQCLKENAPVEEKKTGNSLANFFGFGKKEEHKQVTAELPTYVIFITDGECDKNDKPLTQKVITEAAKHSIFFQFVGLKSAYSTDFSLLTKLDKMAGRFIDNANFFEMKHADILNMSDSALYELLLNEYPSWVAEAVSKGIIKDQTPVAIEVTPQTTTT
jgi:hypothetical protein